MSQTLPEWVRHFFGSAYAQADLIWTPQSAAQIAQSVIHSLKLNPGDAVLDQCCGRGELLSALALAGMEAWGVEQHEAYVEAARQYADQAGTKVRVVCADAGQWAPPVKMDGAVSWHTSLGYGGPEGASILIDALRQALRPGGRYLLELRNLPHYQDQFEAISTQVIEAPEGAMRVTRTSRWEGHTLFQDWEIVDDQGKSWSCADTHCWHPSVAEISHLIHSFGDRVISVENRAGQALQAQDARMVIVAARD